MKVIAFSCLSSAAVIECPCEASTELMSICVIGPPRLIIRAAIRLGFVVGCPESFSTKSFQKFADVTGMRVIIINS